MARRPSRSNSVWFGLLFGLLAGIGTAIVQGATAILIIQGAQLDWYTLHAHNPVDRDTAVVDMAAGVFLGVLIAVGLNGVGAFDLAKKGKLRGNPRAATQLAEPRLWSGHLLLFMAIAATASAVIAGGTAYILAVLDPNNVLPARDFFIAKVALGGVLAFGATYVLVRNIADNHAAGKLVAESPKGNLLAQMALAGSRHAWATLGVVLLITGALGAGILKLETDVDVTAVLPRGNPNTEAAVNVTNDFKSAFTQQVSFATYINPTQCGLESERLLPNRQTEQKCGNITDEVYIRAISEMSKFILRDSPDLKYSVTAASFYELVNWTIAGGQSAQNRQPVASYGIPDRTLQGEARYGAVHEAVWRSDAIRRSIIAPLGASGDMYTNLFLVAPDSDLELKVIGEQAIRSLANYTAWANTPTAQGGSLYKVFAGDNAPTLFVDLPVGDAHASELTREDFEILVPLILVFLAIALFVAFRNVRSILIASSALLISFTWTMGMMGWAELSLSAVNLAIVPLILGVGIDYSIHIITEFLEHKREGLSDQEAFRIAGGRSGIALLIGTLTTVVGLSMMMLSPSLLMAQLGGISAFAMITVFFVSLMFIPAALTIMPGTGKMGNDFVPSAFVPAVARWVSRYRVPVALFVILVTGITIISSADLTREEFGEPAKNFPEDDEYRINHERNVQAFYGTDEGQSERKTNIIVFEGEVTDPRVHRYMNQIQSNMRGKPSLDLSTSRNLPFLITVWLTVKDGASTVALQTLSDQLLTQGVQQADTYPQTQAEVEVILDEVFRSPLATFASLFVNYPKNDISIMTFATETGDFEVAKAGWDDVQAAIDQTGPVPAGADGRPLVHRPSFVGNTALNYLFITEELPWLNYLGIAAFIAVIVLVALLSQSIRATLAVGSLIAVTSIWWLGVLPLVDIGLAITLVLPLAFISAIGSDYAVHLSYNFQKVKDTERVYAIVGKAVLFSAVTTIGPFILFTQTQNVAVAKTMVATAIAIGIILVATLLIMPLYYPLRDTHIAPAPVEADEDASPPKAAPRVRVVDARRDESEGS